MKLSATTRKLIGLALSEDLGRGDVTSRLLIRPSVFGRARIQAREAGVFYGEALVRELVRAAGKGLRGEIKVRDGGDFRKGETVVFLSGPVTKILAVERTLLNFLGHLCGVATATRRFVNRVKPFRVKVFDTRKTTPLWRELEKNAVRAGGGLNHRFGLDGGFFVKENHRIYGDLKKLGDRAREAVIEVRNRRELEGALRIRAGIILFDNFSPAALKNAVRLARRVHPRVVLEASGGITLTNAARYARTGIDRISSGALTHSAPSVNLTLLLDPPARKR